MSEERFQRLEHKLDGVVADVSSLKADVSVLKTDVAELKTDVAELKTDVAVLKTDVSGLRADVSGLKTDGVSIQASIIDLGHQMRVLHEDVLDRIRAADPTEILRAEMRAGFTEVLRALADHAIPGDAADRQFARTLDNHEHRIQTLERRPT